MFINLVIWFYQLFIILPFGFFLLPFLDKRSIRSKYDLSFLILAFLIGITSLTTLTSFLSLFINIGWQVHFFVLVTSVSIWAYLYRSKKIPTFWYQIGYLNKIQLISFGLLFISIFVILFSATTAPENPDTGIYHAQAIRWIETYKAVPGLGNLHSRFAYNSSWLVINALFSLSFLNVQSFHTLPSLLFIVSVIYFYSGVLKVIGGGRKLSDLIKFAFFVASFLLLPKEISSPGTDLPVTLIVWIICSEWIRLIEGVNDNSEGVEYWLAIISLFCTTIKLSSVPILLFVVWVIVNEFKRKKYLPVLVICFAAAIIYAPFIGRNIILSGHLFYPGLKNDPIHVDWGIPSEWVEIEKSTIHRFALLPRVDKNDFATMTWQLQYKKWFYDQIPRHKTMLAFLTLIPLPMLLFLPIKSWRNLLNTHKQILWPLGTMYTGVIFWLITAPTFRFGYGFILSAIVIPSALFINYFISMNKKIILMVFPFISILPTLLILFNAGRGSIHPDTLMKRILVPLDYPKWKTEECNFGNFSTQCAVEWASCWYDPFPCALKGVPNVEMIGNDYSEGFRGIP